MTYRTGFALLVLLVAACMAAPAETGKASRPNIIWVLLDACRAENLSCYGYERQTSPNLDALAERGVVFEWNFAQSHCTNWSVASYMTGRYFPVFALAFGSWRELWRTPDAGEEFLPEILAHNGYHTALFSTTPWLTSESRLWGMFAEPYFIEDPRKSVEAVNEVFLPWLDEHREGPFFAYLHMCATHFPHRLEHLEPPHDQWLNKAHPNGERLSRITDTNRGDFSEADQEYLRGLHDGSIHYEDTHVGRLVAKLRAMGILENTILIVHADHGDALGEDGKSLGHWHGFTFEQVLRVPLIISGPGFPEGLRIKQATENVDIVPTLIEVLGLETSARPDGKSVVPLFANPDAGALHDYVFAKYQSQNVDDIPVFVLRGDKYKYEWNPLKDEDHLWILPDRLPHRRDVLAEAPEAARAMREVIEQRYMPLWDAYKRLPRTSPTAFIEELAPPARPRDAWVFERKGQESWGDGKWTLRPNYLASCGWQEDAPPITFDIETPNATYVVQLSVLDNTALDGRPASSFRVQAEGGDWQCITASRHEPAPFDWWTYVDIGEYTVEDGMFTLTLDEGEPGYWAIGQRLRFVPVAKGVDAASAEDVSTLQEQLRAMGYLE